MPDPFGFQPSSIPARSNDRVEHVIVQHPLRRVLAFTGRSIDDVVNDRIARNHVRQYFKISKWIVRQSEVVELETQWNALRNSIHV